MVPFAEFKKCEKHPWESVNFSEVGSVPNRYKWIRKLRKTSFFLTSQPAVRIHIFTNISRIKGSQTMKFGRSIEYNIRKNFIKKLCRKCV